MGAPDGRDRRKRLADVRRELRVLQFVRHHDPVPDAQRQGHQRARAEATSAAIDQFKRRKPNTRPEA